MTSESELWKKAKAVTDGLAVDARERNAAYRAKMRAESAQLDRQWKMWARCPVLHEIRSYYARVRLVIRGWKKDGSAVYYAWERDRYPYESWYRHSWHTFQHGEGYGSPIIYNDTNRKPITLAHWIKAAERAMKEVIKEGR